MSEEEPGLLAKFPCYVLVSPPVQFVPGSAEIEINGRNNYPVMQVNNEIYLLAFTEKDYAQTYLHQKNLSGNVLLMTIATPEQLSDVLTTLKEYRGGPANVLFDPSATFRGWPVRYEDLVIEQ